MARQGADPGDVTEPFRSRAASLARTSRSGWLALFTGVFAMLVGCSRSVDREGATPAVPAAPAVPAVPAVPAMPAVPATPGNSAPNHSAKAKGPRPTAPPSVPVGGASREPGAEAKTSKKLKKEKAGGDSGWAGGIGAPPLPQSGGPPPLYERPAPIAGDEKKRGPGEDVVLNGRQRPMYWNSWLTLDTDPPSVEPARALEPERAYRLQLDLSGFDYRAKLAATEPSVAAVAPAPASAKVEELFASTKASALIEIVILPDERVFRRDPNDPWSADMQVKTARVLSYDGQIGSPFTRPDIEQPAFRFGHASFRMVTRPVARPTTTSIGISMWANHRPVQELELLVCVDPSGQVGPGHCALPAFNGDTAATALAAAFGADDAPPEGAIHILRLGGVRLVSLLRRRNEPLASALKWRIAPDGDDGFVRSHVNRLAQINKAREGDLPSLGGYLLNDLFEYASDDVRKTRLEFMTFFAEQMRHPPKDGRRRTIAFRAGMSDFVPLGLAALPVGDKMVFFGQQFALEFPLGPARARSGDESCELPWVSVLPPESGQTQDGTLRAARVHLAARHSALLREWEHPGDCTFTDMVAFRHWANQPGTITRRTGLFLLSHHDAAKTMLFLSPRQDDLMSPDDVTRQFAPGSLAVLNACGTGNPAALAFVTALHRRGIDTIVATATEVNADMAADFSFCLARQLEPGKHALPIGDAFDQAIDCLATIDHGKYGARAYTYTLLGDRSTPVCGPPLARPSCMDRERL